MTALIASLIRLQVRVCLMRHKQKVSLVGFFTTTSNPVTLQKAPFLLCQHNAIQTGFRF